MRIVEELISFYRHIYLNLPGFTRLVGVAGAGSALRFGVFPANLYKIREPTSGFEPLTPAHYEFACAHTSLCWHVRKLRLLGGIR